MDNLVSLINLVSCIFALAGIALLIFRRNRSGTLDTSFLVFGGLILFLIGGFNFLEHQGITSFFDSAEDFLIIIFYPIMIFAVYNSMNQQEFKLRKESEQEVKQTNLLLTAIFDSIPVLLLQYDKQSGAIKINREFERKLGWSNEEIQSVNVLETFIQDNEELVRAQKAARKFDGSWDEYMVTSKNGRILHQRWTRIALDENISIGIGLDVSDQRITEKALIKEQRRFEYISKSTNDVLYEWDLLNDRAWWSRGWETHFGFDWEQIGNNFTWIKSVIHPDDFEALDAHFEEIRNSDHTHWFHEYRLINPAGDVIYVWDKGYFIRDANKKAIGLVGAMVNITEEKKADSLLRESEEKYKLLFTKSPLPKCIYDPANFEIIEMNEAALELYGYSKDDIPGLSILSLFTDEDRDSVIETIQKYKETASPTLEWKHTTSDGTLLTVEVSGKQIKYLGNDYRMAVFKDITAQREAEEKALSSFIEGETRERRRLAHDLHDGLGQLLAASNMNLDAIKGQVSSLDDKSRELFNNGMNFLKQAMSETRNISHNLMPRVVEDNGLKTSIQNLVDSFGKGSELDFIFYDNIGNERFSQKIELNMYRIVQECFNNIVKHAEATKVSVQLILDRTDLILTIEDNGKGFDANRPDYNPGIGLTGIKTRTFIMGGIIDMETNVERGTMMTICVPVSGTQSKRNDE